MQSFPEKKKTAKKRAKKDDYDLLIEAAEGKKPKKRARSGKKDDYDKLIDLAESKKPKRDDFANVWDKKSANRKKRKSGGGYTVALLLSVAIIVVAFFGLIQANAYEKFKDMRAAVDLQDSFVSAKVDGVDITGLSLNEALNKFANEIEPNYSNRAVSFDNGVTVYSSQLGYESDYASVIQSVWEKSFSGTLRERYDTIVKSSGEPQNYAVSRKFYSDVLVEDYSEEAAQAVKSQKSDAHVSGFDVNTLEFTFASGVSGVTLDSDKLSSDIKSTLDNGGGNVILSLSYDEPTTTAEDVKAKYGMISSAVTNASSSSSNRLTNITLALNSINGLCLKPDEEFSFNAVVGQRTAERGYKMAAAFSGGEVTEELGGGICQVSTTLFNAAVKANLNITERHAHSMPVSYVDKGKDATVNWGSQDLKFVNTTNDNIYIVAALTDNKRVKIGIFGLMLENGVYITVEAEINQTTMFETTYQVNPFLAPGTQNILQDGRKGYKTTAYKLTWDKDGNLMSKEELCKSSYGKRDQIIETSN